MKKLKIAALCLCAALLCSACKSTPSSSSGQSGSVPASAATEPLPLPASSAPQTPPEVFDAASGQEPEGSEPPPIVMSAGPSFISLPITEAGGAEGEKALVVLHVPESWQFDQYITFSRGDAKIAEFPRLWRAADAAAPFSAEMLAPYQGDGASPEDAAADDLELDGRPLRVLHLNTWMDGSEELWFLHCAFYALDGYVVETHLYTVQDWGGADSEELLAALRTLELHFSEENAGGA